MDELERLRKENEAMKHVILSIHNNIPNELDWKTPNLMKLRDYAFQWAAAADYIKNVVKALDLKRGE